MTSYRMRGYLLIHIGGYRPRRRFMAHVFSDSLTKETYSVPDRIMPRDKPDPNVPEWAGEGWSVGDNPRERFCKWLGPKERKRFLDFDEAVSYIQRLRAKRKGSGEAYTLVYMAPGINGREQMYIVGYLDDIMAADKAIELEIDQANEVKEAQKAAMREEYPEVDKLAELYGRRKAYDLASLLKQIREGVDAETLKTSRSSYYRQRKQLKDAGLLPQK